ncbi:MAG TPA: DUF72 domain-containing protein, partial [Acidobacteriaceae bacterium]
CGFASNQAMTLKHGPHKIHIGTAGWVVPKLHAHAVAAEGSHLQRYAGVANCVEINSTFYRPHLARTFERWVATTPDVFRFAVKLSKTVTHGAKLCRCGTELMAFFDNVRPLGEKLGPVLVQLPPKLAFDEGTAREFFETVRELHHGQIVVEARNASWFAPSVERMLREFEVARAMADPPQGSTLAGEPGGWPALRYYRLHGSPRKYWSEYGEDFLRVLAKRIESEKRAKEVWVIFDNTASNHALGNAMTLRKMVGRSATVVWDPVASD